MARIITYPTKSATLSAVSPVLYSAQNTEVNQIYQDLNDLDAGMALKAGESTQNFATNNLTVAGVLTVQGQAVIEAGKISGTLAFQSNSTPPVFKAGVREFKGVPWQQTIDYNMSSGDSALACNQAFDTYLWYNVVLIAAGVPKWLPAFDVSNPLVTARAITSVVVSGTSFTINMSNTTGMAVGNIIVIKDSNGGVGTCDGPFKIVSIVANVSVTVTGRAVGNATYNGGTVDSYYRIYTLHGAIGGVVTDTDIEKFTPSQSFVQANNIYGLDKYGIPTTVSANVVYRVLGVFYNHATASNIEYVLPYKSGIEKGDDKLFLSYGNVVYATVNTAILRFVGISRAWGNDYTYTDSATLGALITINRPMNVNFTSIANNTLNIMYHGVSINSAALTTGINALDYPWTGASANVQSAMSRGEFLQNGDLVRPHASLYSGSGTLSGSFSMISN